MGFKENNLMGSAKFGEFVVVSDFRGDVEVYRANDKRMVNPVFETHDWDRAVKWAREHTTKQPPRYVDYLGKKAD